MLAVGETTLTEAEIYGMIEIVKTGVLKIHYVLALRFHVIMLLGVNYTNLLGRQVMAHAIVVLLVEKIVIKIVALLGIVAGKILVMTVT